MSEYKISSADIAIRCDATIDDVIDILETKSRQYIPVIYALNKIDAITIEELDLLYRIPNAVPISSEHGWNVDELMEMMWEKLNLRRVYTKPRGKMPDYSAPVVLRSNACTVEDFVSVPRDFYFSSIAYYFSVIKSTRRSSKLLNTPLCTASQSSTSLSESVCHTSSEMRTSVGLQDWWNIFQEANTISYHYQEMKRLPRCLGHCRLPTQQPYYSSQSNVPDLTVPLTPSQVDVCSHALR